MKTLLSIFSIMILFLNNSYGENKDSLIILPFGKATVTSTKVLPGKIDKMLPKNKNKYFNFAPEKDFKKSKKAYLEKIENDELKKKIVNICTNITLWESPLDLRFNEEIALTDLNLLHKYRSNLKKNDHREIHDIIYTSFAANYFAEKLGQGKEYKLNKNEEILFNELKNSLNSLQKNKNLIVSLWANVLQGYNYGLQKKWDLFQKSLNSFNDSPFTWKIQFFVNGMLDELKRKKYK